jgi:hypothetical protein
VYPEVAWDPLKFVRTPRNYWQNIDNQRSFMDNLAKKLNILLEPNNVFTKVDMTSPDDWYSMNEKTLREHGGRGLLQYYRGSVLKGKV